MARPSGEKTRCGGRWTEARYRSFIISALRQATRRWAPRTDVEKAARIRRGVYRCAECGCEAPASEKLNGKKVKGYAVDHIEPVVDPEVGFTTWDSYIERMFSEADNLAVLCRKCHTEKSMKEKDIALERRRKEKELGKDL